MSKTDPNIICRTCRYWESIDDRGENGYCNLNPNPGLDRLVMLGEHWCSYWTSSSGTIQTDAYRNNCGTIMMSVPTGTTTLSVDYDTVLLQQGKEFQYTYPFTPLPNNSFLNFILHPVYNFTCIDAEFNSSKQITVGLYESPSASFFTIAQSKNVNRNSFLAPKMSLYTATTVSSVGLLLDQVTSVGSLHMNKWILKGGNTYLLRVNGENANSIGMRLRWYEDSLI